MKRLIIAMLAIVACSTVFAADGISEEEMMKRWMEAGTPGSNHQLLGKYVGEFDVVSKMWMDPKQPPMESKGVCTHTMSYNRTLNTHFKGDMMGMPFEGEGRMGYANFSKKFWMTWTDNLSTDLYWAEGTASEDGKTVTLIGKMDEPAMLVQDKDVKYVYKFIDENKYIMESWDEVGTPNEFKAMEITYARKK